MVLTITPIILTFSQVRLKFQQIVCNRRASGRMVGKQVFENFATFHCLCLNASLFHHLLESVLSERYV